MTGIFCGSVVHKEGEMVLATVAVIYHDARTKGGTLDYDPKQITPGEYGTETAYLCAACAASSEIGGSVPATVIRTLSLG